MPNPTQPISPISGAETPPVTPRAVTVEVAALTDRGRVRERNEDAFVIYRLRRLLEQVESSIQGPGLLERHEDAGYLMIVADGMGGHAGGEVASREALTAIIQLTVQAPKWVLRFDDPATREREIAEVFSRGRERLARVHQLLREQAAADPELAEMGTTLTGAYTAGTDLFVLHIGDSKAFLLRNGVLSPITRDHTMAQEYADLGLISQEEVGTHAMKHVLTRAIGGPEDQIAVDMQHRALQNGDRVLLCSDGLTDMVDRDEVARLLQAHPGSAEACRALIDRALERGGRDNVTVIVARFTVA